MKEFRKLSMPYIIEPGVPIGLVGPTTWRQRWRSRLWSWYRWIGVRLGLFNRGYYEDC